MIIHGKIVKDVNSTLGCATNNSEPGKAKCAGNRGGNQRCLKQLTLDQMIKKSKKNHSRRATTPMITKQSSNPWRNGIPASAVTRGVRKKAFSTVDFVTKSDSSWYKENVQNAALGDPLPNVLPTTDNAKPGHVMLRHKAQQSKNARDPQEHQPPRVETTPRFSSAHPRVVSSRELLPGNSEQHMNSRTPLDNDPVSGQEACSDDDLEGYVPSSPSDYPCLGYANTEELLAELSYCEKIKL